MTTPDSTQTEPARTETAALETEVSRAADDAGIAHASEESESETETEKEINEETNSGTAQPQPFRSTLTIDEHVTSCLAEFGATHPAEAVAQYTKLAKRFPVLLHTAGLGQALAYLKTVPSPAAEQFNTHLSTWALRNRRSAGPDLLEALTRRTNSFHEEMLEETQVWITQTSKQLSRAS